MKTKLPIRKSRNPAVDFTTGGSRKPILKGKYAWCAHLSNLRTAYQIASHADHTPRNPDANVSKGNGCIAVPASGLVKKLKCQRKRRLLPDHASQPGILLGKRRYMGSLLPQAQSPAVQGDINEAPENQ